MIDAHQHFWQLSRGDYAWPNHSVAPIFRDFGPDDLLPLLRRAGVRRTVLVQATDTLDETRWLLDLSRGCEAVAGVVGWVDLAAVDAVATIDALRADPQLKGLRPMLQGIEDTDWILRPAVQPALAHMARVGLAFDALVQPRHLPAILELARRHPALRIVVDHAAKPQMGGGRGPDAEWVAGMEALAGCPNVWCKLSGLATEIGPGWRQADIEPFAAIVLGAFGPGRTLWGSDWPVVNLASDYAAWVRSASELAASLDDAGRARLFGGTAREFYRLDDRETSALEATGLGEPTRKVCEA